MRRRRGSTTRRELRCGGAPPHLIGPGGEGISPRRRDGGHGVVVDSVNVSVFEYVPVRSASLAPMCCVNPMATDAFDTGPVHDAGVIDTCSADGSENAPFVRWPGSETESVASPAV